MRPWVSPSGPKGGNLDIVARLYNDSGALLAEMNPTAQTTASLDATATGGRTAATKDERVDKLGMPNLSYPCERTSKTDRRRSQSRALNRQPLPPSQARRPSQAAQQLIDAQAVVQ